MNIPLIAPITNPAATEIIIARNGLIPARVTSIAKIILLRPAILATERSIPPSSKTSVCANPIRIVNDEDLIKVPILYAV